jgi:uncharacterized lipoprotein
MSVGVFGVATEVQQLRNQAHLVRVMPLSHPGDIAFLSEAVQRSTTSAMMDTVVTSISKEAMLAAFQNEPKFSDRLCHICWLATAALKKT